MYRVIACDLDGTLLKDDKTISDKTKEALKRITDDGVLFLPSTGRTHRELPQALKELPFLRYALCCNGGAVYDYAADRYIYEDSIPYELAIEVLDYAKRLTVYETVVVNGERIVQGDQNDEIVDYIRKVAVKGILFNFKGAYDVSKAFKEKGLNAQKILLYLAEGGNRDEVIDDLSNRFPELSVSSSGPLFIEVNIKGVDKGKALKNFCELMNIPVAESMAFGDAENDISMLDAAGLAIVMENGTDNTKKHADIICASNNDDGVAQIIDEYWK
ncbi:MAG: HAD family phosphatase [Erysipelotrichaceae bacterium]|nr:HAD family phosphatase [Erysipelotrichaceae bacterium]